MQNNYRVLNCLPLPFRQYCILLHLIQHGYGINHYPVFLSYAEWTYSLLSCVIIKWYISILQEYSEIFFLVEKIGKSFSGFALFGNPALILFCPRKQSSLPYGIPTCNAVNRHCISPLLHVPGFHPSVRAGIYTFTCADSHTYDYL